MKQLEHVPAHLLARQPEDERWLIEELWSERAVGIVGGEPKCCKSLLALDMAVAVASGRPCLRRFGVHQRGRVLLYAAEDPLHVVRSRLEGICIAAGADFETLDVEVITVPKLRLDLQEHRERLVATIEQLRPRLLVLDPFVRMHRIDENASAEVAPLLEHLRALERQFHLAVVLVHHSRKGSAGAARGGQALRGSSELHAWGDSNLYLRRRSEALLLTVEHRAAASQDGDLHLELRAQGDSLALHIVEEAPPPNRQPSSRERVLDVLRDSSEALSLRLIRQRCRMRTATVGEVLENLVDEQLVGRTVDGYLLAVSS